MKKSKWLGKRMGVWAVCFSLLTLFLLPSTPVVAVGPALVELIPPKDSAPWVGQRTESMTYLCETSGEVEIPAVLIRWWDHGKKTWEEKTLPALPLTVLPNPAYAPKESSDLSPEGRSRQGA